jgi:hypothetical protein
LIISPWINPTTVKKRFNPSQIQELCAVLKYDLATGETITTRYFPGFLQAEPSLLIEIDNVKTHADFLARYKGKYTQIDFDYYIVEIGSLIFTEQDDYLQATFYIHRWSSEIASVTEFLHNPYMRYICNPFLVVPLFVTIAVIIFHCRRNTVQQA